MHHEQVAFILGMQGWFNFQKSNNIIHKINRLKQKMHRIISIEALNNPTLIHDLKKLKTSQQTRNRGEPLQFDK